MSPPQINPPSRFSRPLLPAAAVLGFLGVALGAFGAHGLADLLAVGDRHAWWDTATLYHLTHAPAAVGAGLLAGWRGSRVAAAAGWCFITGVVIFSGSLYALATSAAWAGAEQRWLGAVTPIGGVLLLAGWALLAFAARGFARRG